MISDLELVESYNLHEMILGEKTVKMCESSIDLWLYIPQYSFLKLIFLTLCSGCKKTNTIMLQAGLNYLQYVVFIAVAQLIAPNREYLKLAKCLLHSKL